MDVQDLVTDLPIRLARRGLRLRPGIEFVPADDGFVPETSVS